jgi:predicted nucleotidyltransferase component of viral defense system
MTVNVKKALDKISSSEIFDGELYFIGGTALAYYLNHRVSEDIDIISVKALHYRNIIPAVSSYGASKIQDEQISSLRMAGLFPDEYMLKFLLDNVKLDFFQANRPVQKEILAESTFSSFEDSKLKILDLKSLTKLKLVALILRDKSRDLFDFAIILEHKILTGNEIIDIACKTKSDIVSLDDMIRLVQSKNEPQDDEAVYLTEIDRIDLTFTEIKEKAVQALKSYE